VSRRTWIGLVLALGISLLVLSACGSGDLAPDLTPIPTLPPGQEPPLKDAVVVPASGSQTTETTGEETGEPAGENAELVAQGEQLFTTACAGCHGATNGAGPALTGMGERAAERVEGLSAAEYVHESIVEPGAFVVEGFSNIMPAIYGTQYSEEQLDALVAYILTQ